MNKRSKSYYEIQSCTGSDSDLNFGALRAEDLKGREVSDVTFHCW